MTILYKANVYSPFDPMTRRIKDGEYADACWLYALMNIAPEDNIPAMRREFEENRNGFYKYAKTYHENRMIKYIHGDLYINDIYSYFIKGAQPKVATRVLFSLSDELQHNSHELYCVPILLSTLKNRELHRINGWLCHGGIIIADINKQQPFFVHANQFDNVLLETYGTITSISVIQRVSTDMMVHSNIETGILNIKHGRVR